MSPSDAHTFATFLAHHAPHINRPPLRVACEPHWYWKPPPLADHDFWLVLKGVGSMRIDHHTFPLGAGTLAILPPGTTLEASQDPAHRLLVFAIHFDWVDGCQQVISPAISPFPSHPFQVRTLGPLEQLSLLLFHAWRRATPLRDLLATQLLTAMLVHVANELSTPPHQFHDDRIQRVMDAITLEPANPWSIDTMAALAGLSRAQFHRNFRSTTGESPTHFLLRTRIQRAAWLLVETDLPLKQIANELQYHDLPHFHRQFKSLMQTTPTTWRQQSRQSNQSLTK